MAASAAPIATFYRHAPCRRRVAATIIRAWLARRGRLSMIIQY
jgi:hypothetical protein